MDGLLGFSIGQWQAFFGAVVMCFIAIGAAIRGSKRPSQSTEPDPLATKQQLDKIDAKLATLSHELTALAVDRAKRDAALDKEFEEHRRAFRDQRDILVQINTKLRN